MVGESHCHITVRLTIRNLIGQALNTSCSIRKGTQHNITLCHGEILTIGRVSHVEKGELVVKDGEQYLRLTIANQDEPVDIAVKDLVDVYTAGAGIDVTGSVVSVKLAETQGNVTLDTTDGLKANLEGWETVKTASHTHANQTVLDGITAEKVAAWDAKQDAMVAIHFCHS